MWLNHTWFATKAASKPDKVARGKRKGLPVPYPFACFGAPLPTSGVRVAVWGALISVSRGLSLSSYSRSAPALSFPSPPIVQVPSFIQVGEQRFLHLPLLVLGHLLSRLGTFGNRCPALPCKGGRQAHRLVRARRPRWWPFGLGPTPRPAPPQTQPGACPRPSCPPLVGVGLPRLGIPMGNGPPHYPAQYNQRF
jgi:hypothetical protein